MTRYDKELRKHGYKLECDYPWLPYEVGNITIKAVITKIVGNRIVVITCYNIGCSFDLLDSYFNIVNSDFI